MRDGDRASEEPRRKPGRRTVARLAATQALYEMDLAGAGPDPVLQEFLGDRWRVVDAPNGEGLGEPDPVFLADLVRGATGRRAALDEMIGAALSQEWTVERLEALIRAILRLGAYELSVRSDVPARVVISEYVDVAGAFFLGSETTLVNGVLDRLARSLRPDEIEGKADEREGHG